MNCSRILNKKQHHNNSSLKNIRWTTKLFRFHQYGWQKYFVRMSLAPSICCTHITNLLPPTCIMCIFCYEWAKIMRNKASWPENMQNKYHEHMSKSTALPEMNTTRDVTSSLNSVPGPGHRFAPKSRFWQRERSLSV